MAQMRPASQSRFNFVPGPIEGQLAAYQPGPVLDVYQLGWKRGPKGDRMARFSRLLGLLLIIVGLVASVGAVMLMVDVINTTDVISSSLALIIMPPVILFFLGLFYLLQKAPFCIIAFEDYFVYAKRKRMVVLHWYEIVAYERKLIDSSIAVKSHRYTMRTQTGQTLRWKVPVRVIEYLNKIIEEHIAANQAAAVEA